MRAFLKGFLIGTACICLLALTWLLLFRPSLARYEAETLKAAYTQPGPGAERSGAFMGALPAGKERPAPALDLAALQGQYPDVRAWLTIPGTLVDYPVLQSSPDDPEYYLRRNYKGEWRTAGSLFLQSDCALNGRTLVIYGHNMTDGSMFACLSKYLKAGFRQRHSTIQLQTPDTTWEYRVLAVMETDVSRVPFNRTVFVDDADFQSFVQSLLDNAAATTDVPVTSESQLLVLVTCSYSWPEARYVVVAARDQGYGKCLH